jgi:GH24 family phage-related lysozyme (muramidase)
MNGNIVGEPIDGYVQQQIGIRQLTQFGGYNSPRSNDQLQYFTNRNAWVKLASSVEISSAGLKKLTNIEIENVKNFLGTGLAKKAILFNALSEYTNSKSPLTSKRAGITNVYLDGIAGNTLWNDSFAYGIGGKNFGLNPPPGIIEVNIDSLNRGSIRKANITIKAHNKFQFDIIELLYLRLGFTMMLEWGWDKYLSLNSNPNNTKINTISFEDVRNTITEDIWFSNNNYSQIGMLREIQNFRKKYSGNYDGFFGKVSNFSWNFNPDGTYDISIDLITIGDVIESLKVNTSSKIVGIQSNDNVNNEGGENSSWWSWGGTSTPITPKEDSNTVKASYLNTVGYFLYSKQIEILKAQDFNEWSAPGKLVSSIIRDGKQNYYVIRPSSKVGERTTYANKDGSQVNQFYIRLKEFFAQLQTLVIPRIDNNLQLEFELNSCYMTHFPNQISFDPKVCIFKFPMKFGDIPVAGRGEEGVQNPAGGSTTIQDQYLSILAEYTIEKGNGKYIYGDLMNIYVNFEFISGLLLQNGGPDQDLSLFKFLQDLCNGINNALGGVNKLEPIIKDDHVITIIDQTFSSSANNSVNLEVYGYNNKAKTSSFVKDVKFVSKITPQLASMITIGATAAATEGTDEEGSSTPQIEGTAFSKWSEGLIDRFSRSVKEPSGVKNLKEEKTAEEELKREDRLTKLWLTYPTDGGDVVEAVEGELRDNLGNIILAAGTLLGGPIGTAGGFFIKKEVDQTFARTEEEKIKYAKDNLKKLIPPGEIYQNLVGKGGYSLNEFIRLAKEFEDREAAKNVLPKSEIENKIGIDYYIYLVNAFGGKMSKYRVPFRNKSDRSEEVISREYQNDVARYLEFNDTFASQGKSAYKIYINNLNNTRYSTKNIPSTEVGFIPLSFELTLDGISGIKIYNKLNINNDFLPSNYPESLKFVITKVNHRISSNNWETSLSTVSIPQTSEYEFGEFVTPVTATNTSSGDGRVNDKGQTREEILASIQPVNIDRFLIEGDWIAFAANFISIKEQGGKARLTPKWDVNKLRIGFGTTQIFVGYENGKVKTRDVVEGDTTTQENAWIVLKHEIPGTYKDAVVGPLFYKISEEDWNALNKYQKTALVSYAYNCGSLSGAIANAVKSKDYAKVADLIETQGPVTATDTKTNITTLYDALVRRRAEEAALFRYKP